MNKLFTIIASTLFIAAPVQANTYEDFSAGYDIGSLTTICTLSRGGYLTPEQTLTAIKAYVKANNPTDLSRSIAAESCDNIFTKPSTVYRDTI